MKRVITSRHPAAIEFIRQELPEFREAPVLATATAEDVAGAVVAGNLPLHLAAHAAEVVAIEFTGPAPRGAEYTLTEMKAAGACLRRYAVGTPQQVAVGRTIVSPDGGLTETGRATAAGDGYWLWASCPEIHPTVLGS